MSLQIITQHSPEGVNARAVANDVDVQTLDLEGLERIDLNFPKFTDGRAFSQAFVLRRRGFTGDIRAHGDVLIDQLLQMQRSGFSSAVLRDDQDAAHGEKLLTHYKAFYQGDAVTHEPKFARVG
ncbi:MAG: hypothetical protein RIQ36_1769 [Pseudomonadota bacterium]|jgi:uncharacterized protein (DUF934 family)